MEGTTETELTIDQLAHQTGNTVRNIRAHQSRGLLPPPEVRSRTGYYGSEHVARLELIREMQGDGFNLNAIKRLLDGASDAAGEVLGFRRELLAPFEDEQPEVIDIAELSSRFGGLTDPKVLAKAEKLRLIVPLGDGRYEVPSPSLMRAGEELRALGVPLETALRVVDQLRRHSKGIAAAFSKLFLDSVWKSFEEDGFPKERWPEVREAVERLRPLASQALLAVFQQTMSRTVEREFGEALRRLR